MDSLMFMFLMIGAAMATGIRFEEVPCPYGDGNVRKFYKLSANTLGGYDSDLAVYSTRGQFRTHAISTCPSNYFSVMSSELQDPVPAEKGPAIDAAIAEARSEWANPSNPEVWERYGVAAHIASAMDRMPLAIAELRLNAVWTARDAAVGVYVGGLEGPKAAREILNIGGLEFKKDLTPEARKLLRYNLARVAHRGGYNTERDAHIAAYLQLQGLTKEERAAGVTLWRLTQTVEPRLQRSALRSLDAALLSGGNGEQLARARHQRADTLRRLGQTPKAIAGFREVLADADAPEQLKEMAAFLLEEISQ
jgi:hypothetical protein